MHTLALDIGFVLVVQQQQPYAFNHIMVHGGIRF